MRNNTSDGVVVVVVGEKTRRSMLVFATIVFQCLPCNNTRTVTKHTTKLNNEEKRQISALLVEYSLHPTQASGLRRKQKYVIFLYFVVV